MRDSFSAPLWLGAARFFYSVMDSLHAHAAKQVAVRDDALLVHPDADAVQVEIWVVAVAAMVAMVATGG